MITKQGTWSSDTTGGFGYTVDFDPGPGIFNLSASNQLDVFISKLDANGNFVWAKSMGGQAVNQSYGRSISVDSSGNVFTTGNFYGTGDFDPGPGIFNLSSAGSADIFISKLDSSGFFVWAKRLGGNSDDIVYSNAIDASGNVYTTGNFYATGDFDPGPGIFNLSSAGNTDIFISKLNNNGNFVWAKRIGRQFGSEEARSIKIDAFGNIYTTGVFGGTVDVDPSSNIFNLTGAVHVLVIKDVNPCTEPDISIFVPNLRRCFSNQIIYVQARNRSNTSQNIYNSYADVKLNPFLTVTSATRPYTSLGNHTYRFQLDSIYPGQTKSWQISTTVSCSATLNQTLCMDATLYPIPACALDSTPTVVTGVSPCLGPWDKSSLKVEGECVGDSIRFVIYNTGVFGIGDMDCFMPIRIYVDGVLTTLDSLKLVGGDSLVIMNAGDGRTWRLEADQHPLHPGSSHPNASIEACGSGGFSSSNWTSNLITTMPQNDADPVVDIFCGLVSVAIDPNDKTGYPTGVDFAHYILPNQQMQYVIRFQNTGTDTAFKVVIRDTLDADLNIFSMIPGVMSHSGIFRMYGPRILEWTFDNIMLPDSFINEPASNGFVTFSVEQNENLPNGTMIDNSAAIYFDFNAPIITNVAHHEIQRELLTTSIKAEGSQNDIKVYPNPSNGTFNVELPMPSTPLRQQKITICNVIGQVVYISTSLNDQSIEIDLSKQPNGIYFMKVEIGGKEWNKKLIKN